MVKSTVTIGKAILLSYCLSNMQFSPRKELHAWIILSFDHENLHF